MMTHLEKKIEGLKIKKQGLNFAKSVESTLKEKYAEIWEDLDDSYVHGMIRELYTAEDAVLIYFNHDNYLSQIRNRYSIDDVMFNKKNNSYTVSLAGDWSTRNTRIDLKDLFIVTDIDGYIDFMLNREVKGVERNIESYKEMIKTQNEEIENKKSYAKDAKRFSKELGRLILAEDTHEIDVLRKAEKIKNGKASLEEVATTI